MHAPTLSVVIAAYRSYPIVARQARYWRAQGLLDLAEFVLVDDGSDPPIPEPDGVTVLRTDNRLAWTQGLARNLGAAFAHGSRLLLTDLDHILTRAVLAEAMSSEARLLQFPRYFGLLDEAGTLLTDRDSLEAYGWNPAHGLRTSTHRNSFMLARADFQALGGYDPAHSNYGFHPTRRRGDDCFFMTKLGRAGFQAVLAASTIYVFPNGRFHRDGNTNPGGLWHDLSHDGVRVRYKGEELHE